MDTESIWQAIGRRLRPGAPLGELDVPEGWLLAALAAALLVVGVPAVWRVLRVAVTVVHELGHAVVGLLVGRKFTGLVLRPDMSGHVVTVGPSRGPGRVVSTWAGYPAPALLGLAMVVVPLQVGSRSIALPRAAALAFWGWLLGAFSFAAAPALTSGSDGSETAQLLYLPSVGLITVTLVVASICLATTVITLRHPGVDMLRVPVFSWSVLVSSVVWIVSLPVLLAIMVLRYVDLRHAAVLAVAGVPPVPAQPGTPSSVLFAPFE